MEPLFHPESVAEIREINRANLPDLALIEVPTPVKDSVGGSGPAGMRVLARDVPCRLTLDSTPAGAGRETVTAGRTQGELRWRVTFDAGTNVPTHARLTVTGKDPDTGALLWTRVFDVEGPAGRGRAMSAVRCVERT